MSGKPSSSHCPDSRAQTRGILARSARRRQAGTRSGRMKRERLLRHPRRHGSVLRREGAEHTLWENPQTGHAEAIPRHWGNRQPPGKENLSQAFDSRSARIGSVKSLGDPPAVSFAVEVNRKIRAPSTVKDAAGVRSAGVPWRASPRQTKPETRTTPRAARSRRRFCRERHVTGVIPGNWHSGRHAGLRPRSGLASEAAFRRSLQRR